MAKQTWEQEVAAAEFGKIATRSGSRVKRFFVSVGLLALLTFVVGVYVPLVRAHQELETKFRELGQTASQSGAALAERETELKELATIKDDLAAEIKRREAAKADATRRSDQWHSDLSARLKPLASKQRLETRITDGRVVIELSPKFLFNWQQVGISRAGQQTLCEVVEALPAGDVRFELHSFAETQPPAALETQFASSWDLAAARAAAVTTVMTESCGLRVDRLAAIGHGRTPAKDESQALDAATKIELVVIDQK